MQIRIIERYSFKQMLVMIFYSLVSFLVLFSVFKFLEEIERIGRGEYDSISATIYTFLMMPTVIPSILFVSFLTGISLAIGSLQNFRYLEIIQLATYRKSDFAFRSSLFLLITYIFMFFIADFLSSPFYNMAQEYRANKWGEVIVNSDRDDIWIKQGDNFVFIGENVDEQFLRDVKIYSFSGNKLKTFSQSNIAIIEDNILKLEEGKYLELNGDSIIKPSSYISNWNSTQIYFDDINAHSKNQNFDSMNIFELYKRIEILSRNGIDYSEYLSELTYRLLNPLNLFSLSLILLTYIIRSNKLFNYSNRVFLAILLGIFFELITKIGSTLSVSTDVNVIYLNITITSILIILGYGYLKKELT